MGNLEKGRKGEQLAKRFLKEASVQIIGMNLRTEYGEIDILGKLDGVLIFFEVKTRHGRTFGDPESAINVHKKRHMIQSAKSYIMEEFDHDPDWRIDVIAIQKKKNKPAEIKWFRNAVYE